MTSKAAAGPRIISDDQADLMKSLFQDIEDHNNDMQHQQMGIAYAAALNEKPHCDHDDDDNVQPNTESIMMEQQRDDEYSQPLFKNQTLKDPAQLTRSLANIEEQMATIRSKLDKKSPKVTLFQINAKLDAIINILRKNGISE